MVPRLAMLPVPCASRAGSDARAVCHLGCRQDPGAGSAQHPPCWHSLVSPGSPLPSCCGVCKCCSCPAPLQRAPHPVQHPVPCPQLHQGLLLLSPRGATSRMPVPGTPVPGLLCVVSALAGLQDEGLSKWPWWVLWWPCWLAVC